MTKGDMLQCRGGGVAIQQPEPAILNAAAQGDNEQLLSLGTVTGEDAGGRSGGNTG